MNEHTPWPPGRRVAPALAQLRQQVETTYAVEVARALEHLGHLGERDRAVIREFGQRMVEQMVRQLERRVYQVLVQEPTDTVVELLLHLFAGAEARPDQADREAPMKAPPVP